MQTQTTHPLELEAAKFFNSGIPETITYAIILCRFLANLKSSPLDGAKLAECFANAVNSLEN